ncbi:S-adenosyl-L-methionine-dependent methyltransferase [Fusarium flagelliforme]|uniref:S-adenosyl-L-methionine-dependent methyltransferase n=1 Tax=Fusarium flagelliforme TaxID=2675880 RepID=UPI001E8EE138|nr:S-adenosyl-L-methionine-dependent methyltransferase [Fusarium flagelliforme]KAH7191982.1 S-adenosyl-L-methionine-dependent methyltransferase [Fusarium flagelliforme]
MEQPVEDIPHCHHHHHHLQYHTHHHHGPPQDVPRSMGQHNKSHYNNVPAMMFQWPWIIELCNQVSKELRQNINWIGIKPPASRPTKMLDYACGNGVASRALAPFMSTVRGMDISSAMAEQYNEMALKSGYTPTKMHAVQGDIIEPESTPSPELDTPAYFNFDLIVMCLALHHIEDPDNMILQLSKRLRPGGILLIIDWVSDRERMDLSKLSVSRMGFEEGEVKSAYEKAGLDDWSWKLTSTPSPVPREIGGKQQLFFARGMKGGS